MIATFLRESYGRFLASRAAGPTQNQPDATPTSGMCCYLAVGNESCDLDSAVCAIAWAFYQHVRCAGARICVPVLNVPRCDVALRTDVTWALRTIVECEDWAAHVVTREDLHGCFGAPTVAVGSNDAPPKCGVVRVGLVDHNAPCARQGFLAPHVWDVVDHHADNGAVLRGQCEGRGGVYDVRAVGSCTSIVAEYLLQLSKEELEAVGCKDGRLPMELMNVIIITIMLDSSVASLFPLVDGRTDMRFPLDDSPSDVLRDIIPILNRDVTCDSAAYRDYQRYAGICNHWYAISCTIKKQRNSFQSKLCLQDALRCDAKVISMPYSPCFIRLARVRWKKSKPVVQEFYSLSSSNQAACLLDSDLLLLIFSKRYVPHRLCYQRDLLLLCAPSHEPLLGRIRLRLATMCISLQAVELSEKRLSEKKPPCGTVIHRIRFFGANEALPTRKWILPTLMGDI